MGLSYDLNAAMQKRKRLMDQLKVVEHDILESEGYVFTMFQDWVRPGDGNRISHEQAMEEVEYAQPT
jgi:hypothetical protein